MSKEKELLKIASTIIGEYVSNTYIDDFIYEVDELLAQPEKKPLSDKHIAEQAVWAANTKHSFKEGVRWAEKMHGIGESNE